MHCMCCGLWHSPLCTFLVILININAGLTLAVILDTSDTVPANQDSGPSRSTGLGGRWYQLIGAAADAGRCGADGPAL